MRTLTPTRIHTCTENEFAGKSIVFANKQTLVKEEKIILSKCARVPVRARARPCAHLFPLFGVNSRLKLISTGRAAAACAEAEIRST